MSEDYSLWTIKKKFGVLNTYVDEELTDFPVFISFEGDASIATYARPDGYDFRFVLPDDTALSYERTTFEIVDGSATAHFWVKFPTIYADQNTPFYVYYGKADATNGEDVAGTWSNGFNGVWHLDETTGPYVDVSPYGNSGTSNGMSVTQTDNTYPVSRYTNSLTPWRWQWTPDGGSTVYSSEGAHYPPAATFTGVSITTVYAQVAGTLGYDVTYLLTSSVAGTLVAQGWYWGTSAWSNAHTFELGAGVAPVTGLAGGGQDISESCITVGVKPSLLPSATDSFTISIWLKVKDDAVEVNGNGVMGTQDLNWTGGNVWGDYAIAVYSGQYEMYGNEIMLSYSGSDFHSVGGRIGLLSDSEWAHVSVVADRHTQKLSSYANGMGPNVIINDLYEWGAFSGGGNSFRFGTIEDGNRYSPRPATNLLIDEARYAGVARSAAWVKLEYYNLAQPAYVILNETDFVASGGLVASGVAPNTITNLIIEVMHGGVVTDGLADVGYGTLFSMEGGIILDGSSPNYHIVPPPVIEGLPVINPSPLQDEGNVTDNLIILDEIYPASTVQAVLDKTEQGGLHWTEVVKATFRALNGLQTLTVARLGDVCVLDIYQTTSAPPIRTRLVFSQNSRIDPNVQELWFTIDSYIRNPLPKLIELMDVVGNWDRCTPEPPPPPPPELSGGVRVEGSADATDTGNAFMAMSVLDDPASADIYIFDIEGMATLIKRIPSGTVVGHGLACDGTYVYWTEKSDRCGIVRGLLTDNSQELLVDESPCGCYSHTCGPESIAVDTLHGKIYWSIMRYDYETALYTNMLRRANLADGSDVETIVTYESTTNHYINSIQLDLVNGYVYFQKGDDVIQRCDLDGVNVVVVTNVSALGAIDGMVLYGDHLYFTAHNLYRISVDGTGLTTIHTAALMMLEFCIDVPRGYIYVTESAGMTYDMYRMDLDGSNAIAWWTNPWRAYWSFSSVQPSPSRTTNYVMRGGVGLDGECEVDSGVFITRLGATGSCSTCSELPITVALAFKEHLNPYHFGLGECGMWPNWMTYDYSLEEQGENRCYMNYWRLLYEIDHHLVGIELKSDLRFTPDYGRLWYGCNPVTWGSGRYQFNLSYPIGNHGTGNCDPSPILLHFEPLAVYNEEMGGGVQTSGRAAQNPAIFALCPFGDDRQIISMDYGGTVTAIKHLTYSSSGGIAYSGNYVYWIVAYPSYAPPYTTPYGVMRGLITDESQDLFIDESWIADKAVGMGSGIAIDEVNQKIYWSVLRFMAPGVFEATLRRANLADGSGAESLLSTPTLMMSLRVVDGALYWCGLRSVHRAALDGSGMETLYDVSIDSIIGGVDVMGDYIYFVTYNPPSWEHNVGYITRMNLDGSNRTLIYPGVDSQIWVNWIGGLCVAPNQLIYAGKLVPYTGFDVVPRNIMSVSLAGSNEVVYDLGDLFFQDFCAFRS